MLHFTEKEIRNYARIFSIVQKERKDKLGTSETESRSRWKELESMGNESRTEGRGRGGE